MLEINLNYQHLKNGGLIRGFPKVATKGWK